MNNKKGGYLSIYLDISERLRTSKGVRISLGLRTSKKLSIPLLAPNDGNSTDNPYRETGDEQMAHIKRIYNEMFAKSAKENPDSKPNLTEMYGTKMYKEAIAKHDEIHRVRVNATLGVSRYTLFLRAAASTVDTPPSNTGDNQAVASTVPSPSPKF